MASIEAYIPTAVGLWIAAIGFFSETLDETVLDMGYAMMLYGVINYGALWLYEHRKKSWFTLKQKKQVEDQYGKRWCGLWHKEDEAISALSNIRQINAPIIPSNFLYPIVSSLQFISVIFVGLYFALDIAFDDSEQILSIAHFFLEDMENEGFGVGFFTWMMLVMILAFCIPIIWGFTKILSFLAGIVGRPLSSLLNTIVWTSIKQRAWGDFNISLIFSMKILQCLCANTVKRMQLKPYTRSEWCWECRNKPALALIFAAN
jgi:hypothetical protein